jgi:hypothetical protein
VGVWLAAVIDRFYPGAAEVGPSLKGGWGLDLFDISEFSAAHLLWALPFHLTPLLKLQDAPPLRSGRQETDLIHT